jgi:hypothetical protein
MRAVASDDLKYVKIPVDVDNLIKIEFNNDLP